MKPDVAFKSTAVVESFEDLPSLTQQKKRKRGISMTGGNLIYNGILHVSSPLTGNAATSAEGQEL
jgi:hypothetical protein